MTAMLSFDISHILLLLFFRQLSEERKEHHCLYLLHLICTKFTYSINRCNYKNIQISTMTMSEGEIFTSRLRLRFICWFYPLPAHCRMESMGWKGLFIILEYKYFMETLKYKSIVISVILN